MPSAYQIGFEDGTKENRNDRIRRYQSNRAEKDYWNGYLDAMVKKHRDKMIVRCEHEGKIFATDSHVKDIQCPTCARVYSLDEHGKFVSDRTLTILYKPTLLCYRTACKVPITEETAFFNRSTQQLYCQQCAIMLNRVNEADATKLYGGPLCIPKSQHDNESSS